MKSGLSHLRKRTENEGQDGLVAEPPPPAIIEREMTENAPTQPLSELEEPRWSVVSFDRMEAGGLTYMQASKLMSELDTHGAAGLSIVTDEAAERMKS